jgi:hypothetical protein
MIDADVETIDDSEGAEVAAMVPFSSPEIIADTDIPLAGVAVQDATQGGFSAWWIAATLLAGLLVGACAMFIVLKRLRRKNDASEATGKNQL